MRRADTRCFRPHAVVVIGEEGQTQDSVPNDSGAVPPHLLVPACGWQLVWSPLSWGSAELPGVGAAQRARRSENNEGLKWLQVVPGLQGHDSGCFDLTVVQT